MEQYFDLIRRAVETRRQIRGDVQVTHYEEGDAHIDFFYTITTSGTGTLHDAVESQEIKMAFSVGKKQCDTIEDLKKIGGIWHEFEVEVNNSTFRVSRFGADLRLYDNGEPSPRS